MRDNVRIFIEEFNKLAADCQKFCYMGRAKEFQADASQKLLKLKENAQKVKEEVVSWGDEDSANLILSFEAITEALVNELKMWIAFKEDDPNSAWEYLIDAQGATRAAIQAHPTASHLDNYNQRLHALEKLLFPPQSFISPGMIIERSECSICRQEYGECNHLRGKAYMGKMCARRVTKVRFEEVSLVDEPASKHARILRFTDKGVTRDFMTWRVISENIGETTSQ